MRKPRKIEKLGHLGLIALQTLGIVSSVEANSSNLQALPDNSVPLAKIDQAISAELGLDERVTNIGTSPTGDLDSQKVEVTTQVGEFQNGGEIPEVADEYSFSPNDKFEMVANPAGINPILQITDQSGKVFQFETTSLRAFNHEKGIFEDPSIDTIIDKKETKIGRVRYIFTGIVIDDGIETLQLPDLDNNMVDVEFSMIIALYQNNQGGLGPVKFLRPNWGDGFAVSFDGQSFHTMDNNWVLDNLEVGDKVQLGTVNVEVNDAVRQTDNKAAQAYIAAFTKSPDAAYNIIKLGDQSLPGFYDEEGVLTVAPLSLVVLNKDLVDLPETN